MSNMDEHQKAYLMAKRAQFAKAASASVGDATSAWVKVQVLVPYATRLKQ